jgi:predicted anti-sigma-YlaC factor YlaD
MKFSSYVKYGTIVTLSCEGATALVSESLDGQSTRVERTALGLHLLCCPGCRRFTRQMTLLRRSLIHMRRRAQRDGAHPVLSLSPEVRERIRKALSEHQGAAGSCRPQ